MQRAEARVQQPNLTFSDTGSATKNATIIHSKPERGLPPRDATIGCVVLHAARFEKPSMQFLELIERGQSCMGVEDLAAAFKFPLDAFQLDAVHEFLDGHSVLVCAPTGAGKTAIAEAAAIAVLARGGRVIYTTPLKALSNQKLHEMRVQFGHDRVGLQTGDASLNAEGDIVVMTTEVLRNILYSSAAPTSGAGGALTQDRMRDVGLVVLDEVHYLGDPDRGSVWEEVIISCPKNVPLLCMSATVQNPEDLGGWITKVHGSCKTVKTSFRPVPLSWKFCYGEPEQTRLVPLLAEKGMRVNPELVVSSSDDEDGFRGYQSFRGFGQQPKRRSRQRAASFQEDVDLEAPSTEEALEALRVRELLPAIWFVFSRKGCDDAVLRMHTQGITLANAAEREIISRAILDLQTEQPEAIREAMLEPLRCGIASHHAGCLPSWKALIELLYQQGVIKVVFATGTLAAGINMPARSTVISSLSRRIGNNFINLGHNELSQMAGRAGRRGFDTAGHCVLLQDRFSGPQEAVAILRKGPEPLRSQFATGYGMALRLLHYRSLEAAREFVERSFFNYLADEGIKARRAAVVQAEEQAEELLAQAAEAEAAAGGTESNFGAYLGLKKTYQDARKDLRRLVRASCRARGEVAEQMLADIGMPVVVGLEYTTLDLGDETQTLPALLLSREEDRPDSDGPDDVASFLCLSVDNRLFRVGPKHIAAISLASCSVPEVHRQPVMAAASAVQRWQHVKSGSYLAPGSALTAGVAARISDVGLQPVVPPGRHSEALAEAQQAVDAAKAAAEGSRRRANQAKSFRQDLQLRAEATKLKRRAREMAAALESTSARQNSTWKAFENTLRVLVEAGALEKATLEATPLGQVARDISAENELWIAMVLTHVSTQALKPPVLAAVVSAMVAGESTLKPGVSAKYGCSDEVIEAVESMEPDRERLYYLQLDADVEASLTVDLRLSGIVEGWASGLTWDQIMLDCNIDGGDVARLLSRTMDLLRQAGRCSGLLPGVRESARRAASAMSRAPINDLVQ